MQHGPARLIAYRSHTYNAIMPSTTRTHGMNEAGALLPASTNPSSAPPLVVLTGAGAALDPRACTGMLGYGMSKQATHFLVRSLAAWFEAKQAGEAKATVVAVLPTTLDTPANRAAMPGADFGGWTKVCLCGSVCGSVLWGRGSWCGSGWGGEEGPSSCPAWIRENGGASSPGPKPPPSPLASACLIDRTKPNQPTHDSLRR